MKRRRLEELKRIKPPKEEQRPEVKRLVEIFKRASHDETGATINNMEFELAAEAFLNLKERQAPATTEAMDLKKSCGGFYSNT